MGAENLPEEELAGGLDALAATGQDAVTGVEADGAGGSLGGSRNGGSRATLAAAVAMERGHVSFGFS
jgi:hypothetical protein